METHIQDHIWSFRYGNIFELIYRINILWNHVWMTIYGNSYREPYIKLINRTVYKVLDIEQ